jgi:flagellar motor switch protein FliN
MANEHETTSAEDQALADEWAAALEETGDVGQADIDALLAADAAKNRRLTACPWKSSAACRATTSRSRWTVPTWT